MDSREMSCIHTFNILRPLDQYRMTTILELNQILNKINIVSRLIFDLSVLIY